MPKDRQKSLFYQHYKKHPSGVLGLRKPTTDKMYRGT